MRAIEAIFVLLTAAVVANNLIARPPNYSDTVTVPQIGGSGVIHTVPANLNELPCNVANIYDAMANNNTPATKAEIDKDSKFRQVEECESIFHNFRDGVLSDASTPEEVSRAMGRATLEYWLEKAGLMSRSEWQVLDPNMPNIKYVSQDGREAVYDENTGQKVERGINAGTSNVAKSAIDPDHWYNNGGGDIGRFTRCKTPNELQREVAKFLVEHPELVPSVLTKETFLRLTDTNQAQQCTSSQQPDLHSLDLDDPNGDWCKCESPGCVEHVGRDSCGKVQGYVTIQCSKCGKINVEYARKALSFESQAESQGVDTTWTGNRSDAVKAAQGK